MNTVYMKRAIALAKRGLGWVNPNPLVGCVIVKDNQIIGEGFHQKFGTLHAERRALTACVADPRGAEAYVTLEPCNHYGKTPPCTEALVQAGIGRVYVGSFDPNPLVAGQGIAALREAGIDVIEDVLRDECDRLNGPFFHHVRTGKPLVILKWAATADGKIATRTSKSRWITGEVSRARVHWERARYGAVLVGRGTVAADNPQLTARLDQTDTQLPAEDFYAGLVPSEIGPEGRLHQPLRVFCDTHLTTPSTSDLNLLATIAEAPLAVVTACGDDQIVQAWEANGCQVIQVPLLDDGLDMDAAFAALGDRGIDSVYVEGGPTLAGNLVDHQLFDEVHSYIAPKLFGSSQAAGPIGGVGVDDPSDAAVLDLQTVERLGRDLYIEWTSARDCLQTDSRQAEETDA